MGTKKPIQTAEKTYDSIHEFCEEHGLSPATVDRLRKQGMSYEEIIEHKPKKLSERVPVVAEGHTFPSILQFCAYYGLKYPSVVRRIKKGEDGDTILKTLMSVSAMKRAATTPCVVNGVEYPSMTAAAEALNVPVWRVYAVKNSSTVSPSEAVQRAVDMIDLPDEYSGRPKCVVAGKEYPSQRAAVEAYGTKLSTVTTRMQRYGISFEEAVLQSKYERIRIVGNKSMAWDFSVVDIGQRVTEKSLPQDSKAAQIGAILEKFDYEPRFYRNISRKESWIGHINPLMRLSEEPLDIYILCDETSMAKDVEIVAVNLYTLNENDVEERASVLEKVNESNGKYCGGAVWIRNNTVCASASYISKSRSIVQATFMKTMYRLLGTAESTRQALRNMEKVSVLV